MQLFCVIRLFVSFVSSICSSCFKVPLVAITLKVSTELLLMQSTQAVYSQLMILLLLRSTKERDSFWWTKQVVWRNQSKNFFLWVLHFLCVSLTASFPFLALISPFAFFSFRLLLLHELHELLSSRQLTLYFPERNVHFSERCFFRLLFLHCISWKENFLLEERLV